MPRNVHPVAALALRARRLLQRNQTVAEALAPFGPMGWCAGIMKEGREPMFFFGGEAVQGERPVERDTIFRIASVSKMFGAAAALRLVRAGKLTLDGDISDVFGFRVTPAITLRQLLTHTASLRDGVYDAALESGNLPPLNELLPKSFAGYAPGTRYSYSNLGAGVAGMLVEKASGMLFDDYVRSQFFLPYGVDASFHPQRIRDAQRLANCYEMPGGQLSYHAVAIAKEPLDEQPNPLRHYIVPAGKLMISAPNLLACVRRLWLEDRDMFVHQKGIGSVPGDSGRGLGCSMGIDAFGCTTWGHQGNAYGAIAQAWIAPERQTYAVLLTNGVKQRSMGGFNLAGQSAICALLDTAEAAWGR